MYIHPSASRFWMNWPSQVVLVVKNLPANAGNVRDKDSIPELGQSPVGGHGNPLQYSYLENPYGQRSLAIYSPWGHKELDMTEQLGTRMNRSHLHGEVFLFPCQQQIHDWHSGAKYQAPYLKIDRISLAIQWIRLPAPNAGSLGFDPWLGNQDPTFCN